MPSVKCNGCGGTVSTVRRGQPVADALAQHVRLSHPDRPATATMTSSDDDEEADSMPTRTIISRPAWYDVPTVDYSALERLPFFVYGTLRPGFGNDYLWKGRATVLGGDGEARLHGFRLVGTGIPYALPAPGETTVGTLVVPDPIAYSAVAARLDALEGYPVHYDRLRVAVALPWDEVEAWVYSPAHPERYANRPAIPGNDFNALGLRLP